jgi:hypothetical protein
MYLLAFIAFYWALPPRHRAQAQGRDISAVLCADRPEKRTLPLGSTSALISKSKKFPDPPERIQQGTSNESDSS